MKNTITVQVIGATGYGGVGIIELLMHHPNFEITSLLAKDTIGMTIDKYYPHLNNLSSLPIKETSEDTIGEDCDIIVFATPDTVAADILSSIYKNKIHKKIKVVDFSGDFRFSSENHYKEYAEKHPKIDQSKLQVSDFLNESVYGLPELYKQQIENASLVGNPGCFAVSMILGLAPLNSKKIIDTKNIIIDAVTGTSGAGKTLSEVLHFSNMENNYIPYRALDHQHVAEVKKVVSDIGNSIEALHFVPHLIPATRGIMSTIHVSLLEKTSEDKLLNIFQEYYASAPFVRVSDKLPTIKNVRGSNYCDISLKVDESGEHAVIFSAIDNLLKGQSGNALQCMNIMFGLEETTGLKKPPLYP
jgi:N-acetyl-gamma-glutamyl-phosphate reductase